MSISAKEMQRIRGIGEALAPRLLEAGHDTFAKIVALGPDGLRQIKGVNPGAIPAILEQAARLAAEAGSDRTARVAALRKSAATLRQSVQTLTLSARDRFGNKLSGKTGRKLTEAVVRFIGAAEKIESGAHKGVKRTGKGLVKAEQRLEGLAEAGLKALRKGLKKARKALQRVQA